MATTKRLPVGAHYGLGSWLAQRVTAVVLTAYTLILLGSALFAPELNYGTWSGLFAPIWMKVLSLLAIISLLYHVWVGVRNIYMDYIKPVGLRFGLQATTLVLLVGYSVWAVIILWRV